MLSDGLLFESGRLKLDLGFRRPPVVFAGRAHATVAVCICNSKDIAQMGKVVLFLVQAIRQQVRNKV